MHVTAGNYDTERLIEVLSALRKFLGGEKATLLWDGLSSHHSAAMRAWIRAQRSWLVVERLPAYTRAHPATRLKAPRVRGLRGRTPSLEEGRMGEVASYPVGTFSWVDLGTTDVEGAKAFYGELFGWQTEDMRSSQGSYTMCRLHGRDVAGIHEHAPDEGVGWGSSISVDDVDRVTARARELGATVLAEPFDVQGVGRTAVLQDPSGAVVSLWQPRGHAGAGLVNEVGTWTWNELVTPDLAAAKAFYAELFGWGAQDIPGVFPRTSFSLGDLLVGGGHAPSPQEGPAPRWTISFRVADADQSVVRAQELGGSVLLPPIDVPVGRFAIVADPAGASFSVTAVPGGPVRGVDGS